MTVRLFPGIWMVIFTGDDAPQPNGPEKASKIGTSATTTIRLGRDLITGFVMDMGSCLLW
jgi:hypothetical protein